MISLAQDHTRGGFNWLKKRFFPTNDVERPASNAKKAAKKPRAKKIKSNAQLERLLDNYLRLHNFKVHDVPGDGNCFFSALSYQLYGTIAEGRNLRLAVVEFMDMNKYLFQNKLVYPAKKPDRPAFFAAYLNKMKKISTWATSLEISAASTFLQCQITIYCNAESNNVPYNEFKIDYKPYPALANKTFWSDTTLRHWQKAQEKKKLVLGNYNNYHFVGTDVPTGTASDPIFINDNDTDDDETNTKDNATIVLE